METVDRCNPNFRLTPGVLESKYKVVDTLGAGNYGNVSKVISKEDGSVWAAKTMIGDTSIVEECYIYSCFEHPGITKTKDIFYACVNGTNHSTIVMEYGVSLMHYLSRVNLSEDQKKEIIFSIIDTFDFLQRNGVIYGDIKPDNMIVADGRVKIIDFGLIYKLGYGLQPYSQSYGDIQSYDKRGVTVYTDTDMKVERDNLVYDYTSSSMWALAMTIIKILTGNEFYGDYVGGVPKLLYDMEHDLYGVIDNLLIPKYPDWQPLIHRLMAPAGERATTFASLKSHFSSKYKSYRGVHYDKSPPPIGSFITDTVVADKMIVLIKRTCRSITVYNLALEIYLRTIQEVRPLTYDYNTGHYHGDVCQGLAAVFVAASALGPEYAMIEGDFEDDIIDVIKPTDEAMRRVLASVYHYVGVYIGQLCGNTKIDIPCLHKKNKIRRRDLLAINGYQDYVDLLNRIG